VVALSGLTVVPGRSATSPYGIAARRVRADEGTTPESRAAHEWYAAWASPVQHCFAVCRRRPRWLGHGCLPGSSCLRGRTRPNRTEPNWTDRECQLPRKPAGGSDLARPHNSRFDSIRRFGRNEGLPSIDRTKLLRVGGRRTAYDQRGFRLALPRKIRIDTASVVTDSPRAVPPMLSGIAFPLGSLVGALGLSVSIRWTSDVQRVSSLKWRRFLRWISLCYYRPLIGVFQFIIVSRPGLLPRDFQLAAGRTPFCAATSAHCGWTGAVECRELRT
jgi:hypothetical protein